jgi:hypothetical protein
MQQNAGHNRNSQQGYVNPNPVSVPANGMYQDVPFTGQAPFQPGMPTAQPTLQWETLITSTQPSPQFGRLVDAIFNYFTAEHPSNPQGFDPIKYAAVFTALMYTDSQNKPRDFFIFATQNHFPSPESFVYDALPIYYRNFSIQYVMQGNLPILTREGFHTIMLRDALGDPDVQCRRLNAFVQTHGARLVDPATGQPFPGIPIPRNAFPATSDPATWARQRQMNEAFNRELGDYLSEMRRVGRWTHDVTMASMSNGVWVRRDVTYNTI